MVKWLKAAVAILLVGLMGGCLDFDKLENQLENIDLEGNVSPTFVFPLVNSSITLKELVERENANTIISTQGTKYYIGFKDTINLKNEGFDFNISDDSLSYAIGLASSDLPSATVPAGISIGPFTYSQNETFEALGESGIKRIDLTQGSIKARISSTFRHNIDGTITIRSLKKVSDNSSYSSPFSMNTGGMATLSIDLSTYYLDLYDESAQTYNTVTVEISFSITSTGQPILASDSLGINLAFSNLDYSVAYGKIYNYIYLGERNMMLDVFQNTLSANLHLEESNIEFGFKNSYGVPVSFTFDTIKAIRGNELKYLTNSTGSTADSTLQIGKNKANVLNYPANYTDPLVMEETVFKLNHNNSNIIDIIDFAPSRIELIPLITFGSKSDTKDDYFISRKSDMQFVTNIELPLYGYANFMLNQDTLESLNLPEIEDLIKDYGIDSAQITLKFAVKNGMPLNLDMQAYFIDSTNTVLDSLFNEGVEHFIASATINDDGEATDVIETKHNVVLNNERYAVIRGADRIVLRINIYTGGEVVNGNRPSVVIRSSNSILTSITAEIRACIGNIPEI